MSECIFISTKRPADLLISCLLLTGILLCDVALCVSTYKRVTSNC